MAWPKGVPRGEKGSPTSPASNWGERKQGLENIKRNYKPRSTRGKAAIAVWKAIDQEARSEAFSKAAGPVVIGKLMEMIKTGHYTIHYHEADGTVTQERMKLPPGDLKGLVLYSLPYVLGMPGTSRKEKKAEATKEKKIGRRGKDGAGDPMARLRKKMEEAKTLMDDESGDGPGTPEGPLGDGPNGHGSLLEPDGVGVRAEADDGREGSPGNPVSVSEGSAS